MDLSMIWRIIKNLPIILPLLKQLIGLFGDIADKKEKATLADKIREGMQERDSKKIADAYKKAIDCGKKCNPKL